MSTHSQKRTSGTAGLHDLFDQIRLLVGNTRLAGFADEFLLSSLLPKIAAACSDR